MSVHSIRLKPLIRVYLSSGSSTYFSEDGETGFRSTFTSRSKIQVIAICIFFGVLGLSNYCSFGFKLLGRIIIYGYLLIDLYLLYRKTEVIKDGNSLMDDTSSNWIMRLRHSLIGLINVSALFLSFGE